MNILPFPARDANVKQHPLVAVARRALAGDAQALGTLISTLDYSRPEILLAKRAIGADLAFEAGEIERHLVGALARALLATPGWVIHTYTALRRLKPGRFDWLTADLPYACKGTADPDALCLVNRAYRPLCCPEKVGYVSYEGDAAVSHITRNYYRQLQQAGAVTKGGYFTDRNCSPSGAPAALAEYMRRVRILLSPWVKP